MLKKKTCLLLGAGASQHLGFPLGSELRLQMLKILFDEREKTIADLPSLTGTARQIPDKVKVIDDERSLFYDKLAYGNWSSPDAFLEKHREFIPLGKYLMCDILARHENVRAITMQGGWYDKLVSAIHVDDQSKLKDNGLSIVTFNYDRSIEFRLHKYVENHFGVESSEAWKILQDSIPIVHVHGLLGEYPNFHYGDKSIIYERANDIKIIHEADDKTEEFQLASKLLNEAEACFSMH